jgi:hypothetical protein
MKNIFRICAASVGICLAANSYCQGTEKEADGVVGWSPIAIGLATPVQLPWGFHCWDVYGLDLNVFYSDAPKVYGFNVAGLAGVTRDKMIGFQTTGLFNFAMENVYGLRATLGLNLARKNVYGAEIGGVGLREKIYGLDVEFLGAAQREMCGLQVSLIANVTDGKACGCSIAGGTNLSRVTNGLQLALIFNGTEELNGAQIGLVNFTDYCASGFQIGLINVIMSNQVKVLPIVNGYF